MNIELPVPALGILTLLGFLAPYAIALVNRSWWSPPVKKVVAVVASIVLAAIALALYYWITGDALPHWPLLILLVIVVCQASYNLVTRDLGAAALERATSSD